MLNRFLFLIAFLMVEAWTLNPLHHAQYSFYPKPFRKNTSEIQLGARSTLDRGDAEVPLALLFGLGNSTEIGLKYQFSTRGQDFDKNQLKNSLDLGLRVAISKIETIQMDVQMGLGQNARNGVVIGYDIYHALTKSFQTIYQSKVSLFEAHNGSKEVALVEFGLYPRVRFGNSFHVISGLSYSTSITSMIDYSAFDISPGFEIRLNNESKLQFLVDMGIAGASKQEPFLFNLGLTYDF